MSSNAQNLPFAHMVFFALTDRSRKTRTRFVDACHRFLGGHEGQTHFSVGTRATEMQRSVNDQDFTVSMHIVFRDIAAFEAYTRDPRHDEFITATAGLSPARRVFDSLVVEAPSETTDDQSKDR